MQDKYSDFGPTLAAEKLNEIDGIKISTEWLRQLMIKKNLWRAKQKHPKVHHPRVRRLNMVN